MCGRKKWDRRIQWVLLMVFLGESVFLLSLDRLHGFYISSPLKSFTSWGTSSEFPGNAVKHVGQQVTSSEDGITGSVGLDHSEQNCESWLEEVDELPEGRNFATDPVLVSYGETQVWDACAVGCVFKSRSSDPDGLFKQASGVSSSEEKTTFYILRSMESASYYPENDVTTAHQRGFDVVMTTSLASDVPVGYFSWAEYDLMAPVALKTEKSLAAAFISNCAAHNFRLEALEDLRKSRVSIDSYGNCHRNHDGRGVNKLETLKRYKFSLAFENSNEEDYVTEKFWQSLAAGSVPVVVGAPNIQQFAPASNALLHIKSLQDVGRVAQEMRYLGANLSAYNETLQWKYEGPSSEFKALVDMAAVHSSCRLCIHIATQIRSKEEQGHAEAIAKRPCRCTDTSGIITYHLYVRERGRYKLESFFLKSSDLTITGLQAAVLSKFNSLKHVPIWWQERPPRIRGDSSLHIHKIYPMGLTQRDALYSVHFRSDNDVKDLLELTPCPKLEVIFV